jgi:hypothetical protein
MFLQIYSSPASTQMDFWHFFKKISEFSEELLRTLSKLSKSKFSCYNQQSMFMFMHNFSSPASTQTDLEFFLTFFQENFRIFQKNSYVIFEIILIWECSLMLQLAKHVHAKFNFSSFYSDWHCKLFDIFSRKFQNFSENSFLNFQKFQIWVCSFKFEIVNHVHAKFQLSSFYPDGLRQIFDYFSSIFQNILKKISKFSNSEISSK